MIWHSYPPPLKVMAPKCQATCPKVVKILKNQCFSRNRSKYPLQNRCRRGVRHPDQSVSQSNITIMHSFVSKIHVRPLKVGRKPRFLNFEVPKVVPDLVLPRPEKWSSPDQVKSIFWIFSMTSVTVPGLGRAPQTL